MYVFKIWMCSIFDMSPSQALAHCPLTDVAMTLNENQISNIEISFCEW